MYGYIVFWWRGRELTGVIESVKQTGSLLRFIVDNSEIVEKMERINGAKLIVLPSLWAFAVALDTVGGTALIVTTEGNAYAMFYAFSSCSSVIEDRTGSYSASNYVFDRCDSITLRRISIYPDRMLEMINALRNAVGKLAQPTVI